MSVGREEFEERARRHHPDRLNLSEVEEMAIAAHEVIGASFQRGFDVPVVVRILRNDPERNRGFDDVCQDCDRREVRLNLGGRRSEVLPDARVPEDSFQLVQDGKGEDEFERGLADEKREDSPRRPPRLDEGAGEDIRVQDRAKHGLPRSALSPRVLGLVGKCVRLGGRRLSGACLKGFEQMEPSQAFELTKFLHGNHGGEGMPLPLDDELVVSESHPIQDLAQVLAHAKGR